MSEDKKSPSAALAFVGTIIAAILACVGSITAAGIASLPSISNQLVPILRGTSTPAGTPTISNILFQDNFGDFGSGWERSVEPSSVADYYGGGYRIYAKDPDLIVWSHPNKNWSDVRIEVYATQSGGPDDNAFGVMCRYQNADNYYFFLISSDGYAGIGLQQNNVPKLISASEMQPTNSIKKGKATNHIRAECAGTTLTLTVNGERVANARDVSFASGDVGLMVESYDEGGPDILFDNFVVTKP
jgi:hypothetical protein